MNEIDALELVQQTIWTVITVSAPCVAAAVIVGLAVALGQALTQIQEMTLTFVPKIIAIFLVALVSATYMGNGIVALASLAFARIEKGF